MAADKTKLEIFLNSRSLLREEKKMWYRVGFYVYPDATVTDNYGTKKTQIVDATGNIGQLGIVMAQNLRVTILEWWQGEKIKPRREELKQDIEVGPYDELENRNTT